MLELLLVRSSTINALENEKVKKILPRYIRVVDNKLSANFQILKKIEFKPKKNLNNQQLLEFHEKLLREFYQLKKKIDSGKIRIEDIPNPKKSLLDLKILLTEDMMKNCELCERRCGVNRLEDQLGECKVGNICRVSSEFAHFSEESFLVPSHTIFFMGCNFHCQFCQNYSISQWSEKGFEATPEIMATWIEQRKEQGCRNVNWVGGEPTPNLLWILESLKLVNTNQAVVWNSNFYMTEKTMRLLDGAVDVYLSDFKYGNDKCAERLSKVKNYFEVCSRNHIIATKQTELVIRHLILPNHVECCSKPILKWIAKNVRDKSIVNLMDQYRPEYKAYEYEDISRKITNSEFSKVLKEAKKLKINYIT
ncbi:MAG: radical SAM protein [Candidatus Aenigmarchaeota archaeon]|nr:radical SAM protein [Candidatus Aenigmarchaeota archaeon]